jgi:hypothetical protein
MHYGVEEMRQRAHRRPQPGGEEELAAGDFLFCPEGQSGGIGQTTG